MLHLWPTVCCKL